MCISAPFPSSPHPESPLPVANLGLWVDSSLKAHASASEGTLPSPPAPAAQVEAEGTDKCAGGIGNHSSRDRVWKSSGGPGPETLGWSRRQLKEWWREELSNREGIGIPRMLWTGALAGISALFP